MQAGISNPQSCGSALYARLSREDGGDAESQSIANQRSLLLDYADRHGIYVYDVYIDDGWSGTSFDRPAFNRMLRDIESKKVNMVITKDMSRLGRDYIQTGYYLERYFPENRVRYISILDGVDTGIDSSANDITPFKAIMNDMYAKDISKKIKSVKRDKQKKGLFIGGKAPYGYTLSETRKNAIVIDEGAARVVRRMFQMALDGMSCRRIAGELNREGVPPPAVYANLPNTRKGPYSGLWSAERVGATLKNEVYIGNMVQGRMKKVSYKIKKCHRTPPEEWIVVENTHQPIVERDVFEKAALLIKSRAKTRSRTYDYLLKGILFCEECGHPLGVINRPLAGGAYALYTVCRTYQRFTSLHRCTCHCMRVDTVTQAVTKRIAEICGLHSDCADFETAARKALNEREHRLTGGEELEKLNAALERLTAELDGLYAGKLSGALDEQDFSRFYARLRGERARLREKICGIEKRVELPAETSPLETGELVRRFLEPANINKELLVSLVERVEMNEKKELTIYFRVRNPEQRLQ